MMRSRFVVLGMVLLGWLLSSSEALARAGGGGGGGSTVQLGILGVVLAVILSPFILIWMLIKMAKRKAADAVHNYQLHKAAGKDPFWDEDAIKARVEKIFFTVQRAWMARDQEIAREFVTQRLYDKHKLQTDIMIEQHEKNMLENMNLIEIQVAQVDDEDNNAKDKLAVRLRASMIDYRISEKDGHITGSTSEVQKFVEVWKFVRDPKGWLLDEIDQNVDQF